MPRLRSAVGFLVRSSHVALDYALLPAAVLFRLLPKSPAIMAMRIVNAMYPFWDRINGSMERAHADLQTFRDAYDLAEGEFLDPYLRRAEWLTGKRVLDLGCFVGGKTEWFIRNGAAEAVGIDLSERGIAIAKRHERLGLRFERISSSALAEREPSSFDTVYSFTVFEHIDEELLEGVLTDCHRLLRPGGMCVIVYNHYYDRYGSHVIHFIRHAWPQFLFRASQYQEFCDRELARLQLEGKYGYFPTGYSYRGAEHNRDAYMGLNRLSPAQFRAIIARSPFGVAEEFPYSRKHLTRALYRLFPGVRIFEPSVIYVLRKTAGP